MAPLLQFTPLSSLWVRKGDIIFSHSETNLGRLIRWAEQAPGEPPSWTNHVGIVSKSGFLVPPGMEPTAMVVESLWKTIESDWGKTHASEIGLQAQVWRSTTLTGDNMEKVIETAKAFVGRSYGWWKLFGHLADRLLFKGNRHISRFLQIDSRPICSYTVAVSMEAGGVYFGDAPRVMDPDSELDWVESHPHEWVKVGDFEMRG